MNLRKKVSLSCKNTLSRGRERASKAKLPGDDKKKTRSLSESSWKLRRENSKEHHGTSSSVLNEKFTLQASEIRAEKRRKCRKEQKKSRKEQSRKEQKNSLCQWVPWFMFSAAAVSFILMVISIIFYQYPSTRPPSHRTTKLFRLQWGFLYGIVLLMMAVLALDS